ncbi:MAG: FAD-dependent oxidoreductase [Acetobacteraceae bacterium]
MTPLIVSRRALLAALPASLAACAAPHLTPPLPPRRTRLVLAPVDVARSRIIRIDVGLRPFRPAGFVVQSEALGNKTVVHDYGHGGGGVTLSWGTAALALEQPFPPTRHCAVLGCGAVGLATARLLQEQGRQVTIYAEHLPPETTSNIAGAQWWPSYVYDDDALTPHFRTQFVRAAHLAYHRFQTLPEADYGISWRRNYFVSARPFGKSAPADRAMALDGLRIEWRTLGNYENPFHGFHARQFDTMFIEPPIYLPAMMRAVREAGGCIVVRRFNSPEDILRLREPVVFNCTGLGARDLFGDFTLIPMQGQLVVLLPQPEVTYNMVGDGIYAFPRDDGVLLGGTERRGVWSLTPDQAEVARVVAAQKRIFASLRYEMTLARRNPTP